MPIPTVQPSHYPPLPVVSLVKIGGHRTEVVGYRVCLSPPPLSEGNPLATGAYAFLALPVRLPKLTVEKAPGVKSVFHSYDFLSGFWLSLT
jgi:hypothetical protein